MNEDQLSALVVDSAITVQKALGPGLLESAYVAALELEFAHRQVNFAREVAVQGSYRDKPLGVAYRADLVVENKLLVEVKSVQAIESVHMAQVLSYLRLGGWRIGLLLNFHTALMKNGIRRIVHEL